MSAIKWTKTVTDGKFQVLQFETPTGMTSKKVGWSHIRSGLYKAGVPFFVLFAQLERSGSSGPWIALWMGNDREQLEKLARSWVDQPRMIGRSKVVSTQIVEVKLLETPPLEVTA
jgi:hypothetical protein